MKRILVIVVILVIIGALAGCSLTPPDITGQYSGTFRLGSDSGTISLDIISGVDIMGHTSSSVFTGHAELDDSSGSAICSSPADNITDTNIDLSGNITFSVYCSGFHILNFTGTAQSKGWQGNLSDNIDNGTWNAS